MKKAFLVSFLLAYSLLSAIAQPVASVSISETSGADTICAGTSVTFTASPTNGGTSPTYIWYVNGISVAGVSGAVYTTSTLPVGTPYIYSVMASNLSGVTGSPATSDTLYPDVIPRPVAMISDSDTICSGNYSQVTFTISNSNAPWQVIFTNGIRPDTITAFASPWIAYVTPASTSNYHITSVSSNGCTSLTANLSGNGLVVVNPTPVAVITALADSSECFLNNSYAFNGSHSSISAGGIIANYNWNFGSLIPDTASGPTPIVSFSNTTTHQLVTLTVISNYGCSTTASRYIVIKPSPSAAFAVSDTAICLKFEMITQANNNTDSLYNWSWGDTHDSICKCPSLTHTYTTINDKRLKLTVTAINGCTDTLSTLIHIHPLPQINFTINDTAQCFAGNLFIFVDQSTISATQQYLDSLSEFAWRFGDTSSTAIGITQSHSYTDNTRTTYSVSEIVYTSFGCTNSLLKNLTVYKTPDVQIGTNLGSDTVCAGLSYKLIATTDAGRPSYQWSVPDSTHNYITDIASTTGYMSSQINYIVTVTDTANNRCTNTAATTITSVPNTPVPLIAEDSISSVCQGGILPFNISNALGSVDYFWYTSPALPISGQHSPNTDITFSTSDSAVLIYVIATNIPWGCAATSSNVIIQTDTGAGPSVTIAELPDMLDSTLIAIATPDSGITYQWGYNGPGLTPNTIIGATTQDLLLDTGQNSANYWVVVTDTLSHCSTKAYVNPPVTVTGIKDINGDEAIVTVYPNPSADKFNVRIQSATVQSWDMEVMDINGKLIVTSKTVKDQQMQWSIDSGAWAAGAYLLKVISASGDVKTIKLIKE
jgi:hypothetical protein